MHSNGKNGYRFHFKTWCVLLLLKILKYQIKACHTIGRSNQSGELGMPLGQIFFSISCGFWEKMLKITGFCHLWGWHPHPRNSLSATACKHIILIIAQFLTYENWPNCSWYGEDEFTFVEKLGNLGKYKIIGIPFHQIGHKNVQNNFKIWPWCGLNIEYPWPLWPLYDLACWSKFHGNSIIINHQIKYCEHLITFDCFTLRGKLGTSHRRICLNPGGHQLKIFFEIPESPIKLMRI